jgi:hypothetical protein
LKLKKVVISLIFFFFFPAILLIVGGYARWDFGVWGIFVVLCGFFVLMGWCLFMVINECVGGFVGGIVIRDE